MMRSLLLVSALPLLALAQKPAPEFTIDLDLPPRERHREVALFFKEQYPKFMSGWEASLARKLSQNERSAWLAHSNVKEEFQDEIRGFVEAVDDPQVTFERVMLFNLMYELNYPVFCSGIVAGDVTGRVMHGRNLDLVMRSGTSSGNIGDLAVNYTFVRNGSAAFNSHAVAGYVGLHTVLKLSGHHPWSFQQNSHYHNDRKQNLEALKGGAVPFGFFMRELIVEDVDFQQAVSRITNTPFSAPNLFLMAGAGPWEGAAIEVQRSLTDPLMNDVQVLAPQIGRWFLVQTNDRVWEEPQDDRRPMAIQMLQSLGSPMRMNEDSLMRVMRSTPLYNDYTSVSVVSVPASGYVRALLRDEYSPALNLFAKNRRFKLMLRR